MLRKLLAGLAALIVTTGLTLAVTSGGADAKSVLPAEGNYAGVDHGGRMVTLTFSGNYMDHFTVGHKFIGGAHVSKGAWHETCHGGFCTKGMWVTDNHIQGSWREGGGSWTHFNIYREQPIQPYHGTYMGKDHSGLKVNLSFGNGRINAFTLDHSNRGNVPVTHAKFETCLPSICVMGHWQSEYEVVGSWRPVNGSHWSTFDAYAFAI